MINNPSSKKYVMDTNTLMGFSLWLPISINRNFWNYLEQSLKENKWVLLDVVVKEIIYDKELKNWCTNQKRNNLVSDITDDDRHTAVQINNSYPMINQSTFNSAGDTYILAYALNNQLGIFSRENQKTPQESLYKIPDVCQKMKIDFIKNPQKFLESIGYKA